MKILSLEQTADYLESSLIEKTIDMGHALIHRGVNEFGFRFVMVNDMHGETVVSENI